MVIRKISHECNTSIANFIVILIAPITFDVKDSVVNSFMPSLLHSNLPAMLNTLLDTICTQCHLKKKYSINFRNRSDFCCKLVIVTEIVVCFVCNAIRKSTYTYIASIVCSVFIFPNLILNNNNHLNVSSCHLSVIPVAHLVELFALKHTF